MAEQTASTVPKGYNYVNMNCMLLNYIKFIFHNSMILFLGLLYMPIKLFLTEIIFKKSQNVTIRNIEVFTRYIIVHDYCSIL